MEPGDLFELEGRLFRIDQGFYSKFSGRLISIVAECLTPLEGDMKWWAIEVTEPFEIITRH